MNSHNESSGSGSLSQGKRLVILTGVSLAILAGVGLYKLVFDWPNVDIDSATKEQKLPDAQQSTGLNGTDLQSFMDSHGPWLSTSDAKLLKTEVGIRNLALIKSNGVIFSSKSVKFTEKSPWKAANTPPQIAGVDVKGTSLTIQTNKGDTYTFNVTQPFMVEGNLATVYIVDRNKKLWSASVGLLKFEETNTFTDSSIPVNPDISTSIGN